MRLNGRPDAIKSRLFASHPAALFAMTEAGFIPAQLLPYQAAALFALATQYDKTGSTILDIGTAAGYSAAILAQAAPRAHIITLNNAGHEINTAARNLGRWRNIEVVNVDSVDYLRHCPISQMFEMVFIDGDHKWIWRDLGYWKHVRGSGLLLCHDYSPAGAPHPCQTVYDAVNEFARIVVNRDPDVLIVDDSKTGMAGFYNTLSYAMKGVFSLGLEGAVI